MKKFIIVIITMVMVLAIGLAGITAFGPDVERVEITSYGATVDGEATTTECYIVNGGPMTPDQYQTWKTYNPFWGKLR